MAEPDLLGRDALLDELTCWLRRDRRRVMLLRGPAGVGKTAVAAALQASLDAEGVPTMRVRGTESSQLVPFGALAPLLAGGPGPDGGWDHPAAVLTALLASVSERFGDGLVLFVDDVPLLDPGSTTAVLQLVEHAHVRVVATARDEHLVPESVASAASGATGRTWEIEPLPDVVIATLAGAIVGERLSPGSASRVADAARGIPLVAIELVGEARRRGAVRAGSDGAVLDDIPLSARLRDLVAHRLAALDPPDRDAAELLAAGRPLPAGSLEPVLIERLETAAVLAVAGDGTLDLTHPLLGEALREATPPSRWSRRLLEAADRWAALPETPDTVLRTVVLRRAGGGAPDHRRLLGAGRRALELLDHDLVIDLLSPLADAGDHEALVLRGTARSAVGADGAADDLRLAVDTAPDDAALARAAQRLALELGTRGHDAVAAAEAARKAHDLVEDPAARDFLGAEARKWELAAGIAPTTEVSATDPAARLNEVTVVALMATMAGRLDEADALVADGLPLARRHREVLTYGEELLQLSRILAIGFRGDVHAMLAAVDQARTEAVGAGRGDDAEGLWLFLEASAHQTAGSFEDAARLAAASVTALADRDFVGLDPSARGVLAGALARLGRIREARQVLDELPATARQDLRAAPLIARADAALAAAGGDRAGAVDLLLDAARTGVDGGFVAPAALAAHDAVAVGGAERVVTLLDEVAAQADGELFALLADHAAGVASRDRTRLERVARRFQALGLTGPAVDANEALAQQLRAARAPGAAEAARRAALLRSTVPAEARVLTARELEIARAAAGRRRSREIADELDLSVRTVDNHLRAVYRKLGIGGRDELDEALADAGLHDEPGPGAGATATAPGS